MGGWIPSMAHNGAHWLLMIKKLKGRSQFFGNSTPPIKSGGGTLQSKNPDVYNICM